MGTDGRREGYKPLTPPLKRLLYNNSSVLLYCDMCTSTSHIVTTEELDSGHYLPFQLTIPGCILPQILSCFLNKRWQCLFLPSVPPARIVSGSSRTRPPQISPLHAHNEHQSTCRIVQPQQPATCSSQDGIPAEHMHAGSLFPSPEPGHLHTVNL